MTRPIGGRIRTIGVVHRHTTNDSRLERLVQRAGDCADRLAIWHGRRCTLSADGVETYCTITHRTCPANPRMKVEIWSDIACPWCFIGKRRFESAIAEFPQRAELELVWRSFELDPNAPARQDRPKAELLAAKYRMPVPQAQSMIDNMTATGVAEGIVFRFDRSISANTFDAHRLIHFAAEHQLRDAMVERLFTGYFTDGDVISDHPTLVRLAGEIGLDTELVRAMLVSDRFATNVRSDELRAQQFGITGVPFFAIDERYGISGAQPASAIVAALNEAWSDASQQIG